MNGGRVKETKVKVKVGTCKSKGKVKANKQIK